MQFDYRHIPPIKNNSDSSYEVPCTVLDIDKKISSYKNIDGKEIFFRYISIKRLNFKTGEMIFDGGIIYEKAYNKYKEVPIIPFETYIKFKISHNKLLKIVHGVYNVYPLEVLTGTLETDEVLIQQKFNANYSELNEWLKNSLVIIE